jgi:hypothetical protein
VIRLYEAVNNQVSTQALFEAFLEQSRLLLSPTKPSRLDCVFGLPTEQSAHAYAKKYAKTNIVYEIEITKPNTPLHEGDYEIAIEPLVGRYFSQLMKRGERYWLDQNHDAPELLIGGPVRVISRIS